MDFLKTKLKYDASCKQHAKIRPTFQKTMLRYIIQKKKKKKKASLSNSKLQKYWVDNSSFQGLLHVVLPTPTGEVINPD